jgi:hypothetical protein
MARDDSGRMKGDRVEIVIDAGDTTKSYDIVATRAGRRVEVSIARGVAEVTEVTRSGTAVRTARFMASRVIALVEHPAKRPPLPEEREPAARWPTADTSTPSSAPWASQPSRAPTAME